MSEKKEASGSNVVLNPLQSADERHRAIEQLYSPIKSWETRLLGLQPGNFNDSLVTALHIAVITHAEGFGLVDKDQNVNFEALSYTWGDEIFSHPLVCNGHVIGVTANLSTALRHLRQKDDVRYLWVDAVCINQTNNDEKARQIRNLQLVFKRATRVVAWLGDEGSDTKSAVDWLRKWSNHKVSDEDTHRLWSKKNYDALVDLIARPWLSRAWVMQEVYAARSIIVCCGDCSMRWRDFCSIPNYSETCHRKKESKTIHEKDSSDPGAVATRTSQSVSEGLSAGRSREAVNFLTQIRGSDDVARSFPASRKYWSSSDPPSDDSTRNQYDAQDFWDLLQSATHLQATDPRDKIWALVGLSRVPVVYGVSQEHDHQSVALNIDYSKPVEQVYAEVAKFFICSLNRADQLLPTREFSHGESPSWSIDFVSARLPKVMPNEEFLSYFTVTDYPGREGYDNDWIPRSLAPQSIDWNILALSGCHIGTICSLRDAVVPYSDEETSGYLEYFWFFLSNNSSMPKTVVEVLPTPVLRNWILADAQDLQWSEASYGFKKFESRDPSSLRQKTLDKLSRLKHKDTEIISQISAAQYAKKRSAWGVVGTPAVNDIMVQFRAFESTIVLRHASGSRYYCVGRARPLQDLKLKDQGFQAFRREKADLFWDLWQHSRVTHSPRLVPDGGHPEDEQIFEIC